MNALEPLLTVKDIKKILPISTAKVYDLIAQGDLRAVRLTGCSRILVAPDDLRAFIAAGRTPQDGGVAAAS